MTIDDLKAYRDALEIDIEDSRLEENPFVALEEDSDEIKYLTERRTELGGYLPSRKPSKINFDLPGKDTYSAFDQGTPEGQEVSTTMAFVRLQEI